MLSSWISALQLQTIFSWFFWRRACFFGLISLERFLFNISILKTFFANITPTTLETHGCRILVVMGGGGGGVMGRLGGGGEAVGGPPMGYQAKGVCELSLSIQKVHWPFTFNRTLWLYVVHGSRSHQSGWRHSRGGLKQGRGRGIQGGGHRSWVWGVEEGRAVSKSPH